MKKNHAKAQELKWKSRRLSLHRETIQALDQPALLELAGGGSTAYSGCILQCIQTTSLLIGAC